MNSTTTVINSFSPFHPIQFSILLFLIICSIPCFIFVFYQILSTRALYRALNNHVLILLLISNSIQTVTDIPLRLSYYYTGKILPFTVSYCHFYYFIDLYLFTTCFLLLAWASFERHILIFHSRIFNRYRTRLIGHYIPNRNMAIQLFSVCFLFFLTNGGYFLILLGQGLWDPNFGNSLMAWVFPLSFCMPLLIPFMFLHTIQDLKEKIKRFIRCQFHTAIMPITVTVP
ncbi:unnamed protein product [Adineta steineri]|uniref:Uncharacterized protein n=1 Tax=Adineta steineri TaxID=433720 RepID=A0A818X7Q9_9BILA|nr:unnamed protein product [Adineta steineri]CAF3735215.1 unnamed protein product [Adineta steineri]